MYCRQCGCQVGDNDRFCIQCGTPTGNGTDVQTSEVLTREVVIVSDDRNAALHNRVILSVIGVVQWMLVLLGIVLSLFGFLGFKSAYQSALDKMPLIMREYFPSIGKCIDMYFSRPEDLPDGMRSAITTVIVGMVLFTIGVILLVGLLPLKFRLSAAIRRLDPKPKRERIRTPEQQARYDRKVQAYRAIYGDDIMGPDYQQSDYPQPD